MQDRKKIVGTLVPLSALFSSKQNKENYGTFSSGYAFLDWIQKTHQSAWQLLPLHETQLEEGSIDIHVPSPYKSYGIGLDPKFLSVEDKVKMPMSHELDEFITKNNEWIHEYALFCSIRDYVGTDDWSLWEKEIRNYEFHALKKWKEKLKEEINFFIKEQWQLHQAYTSLHKKAKEMGIVLIGDLPFYVSFKSPLVWANQDVFLIEKDKSMRQVSGAPNTPFAHYGRQLWGHPLYNWENKKKWNEIVSFWKTRLKYQAQLFDLIRFDHAKAFYLYGVLDPNDEKNDGYRKGPGSEVFEELIHFSKQCGLSIFAEDSGHNTEELKSELDRIDIAGIKLFRFAYDEKTGRVHESYAKIKDYPYNTVVYTTTHDTETFMGYLQKLTKAQKQILADSSSVVYDTSDKKLLVRFRDALIASPAKIIITPIQDWLLITDRINVPGTEVPIGDPNWHFTLPMSIEHLPNISLF